MRNIFISHVHDDDAGLGSLKDLLGRHGYDIRDSSIHSGRPNNATAPGYIKSEILAPRIRWAGTMVVYISPHTRHSDWVNWEIEYAQKTDTRIIGVWSHGASECDLPDALKKYADAVVGWLGDRIIDAIEGKINNWTKSDGTSPSPIDIPRVRCQ